MDLPVKSIQLAFGKDIGHMFAEPFNLVPSSESKIFRFLDTELRDLLIFVLNPLR